MASTQIILGLACLSALAIGTEGNTSTLEERFEAMEARIEQLGIDKEFLKSKILRNENSKKGEN